MKRSRANSAIIQGICPAFLYIKDDSPTTMLYDYGGGEQLDWCKTHESEWTVYSNQKQSESSGLWESDNLHGKQHLERFRAIPWKQEQIAVPPHIWVGISAWANWISRVFTEETHTRRARLYPGCSDIDVISGNRWNTQSLEAKQDWMVWAGQGHPKSLYPVLWGNI